MQKLKLRLSMSLDGYVAGPRQSVTKELLGNDVRGIHGAI